LAAIAVGTDTGGSIRIPAACCGIVGFKGTHDAVSRAGVWSLADTLDHVGPFARRGGCDARLRSDGGLPIGCPGPRVICAPAPGPAGAVLLRPAGRRNPERIEAVLNDLTGASAVGGAADPGVEYASAAVRNHLHRSCQANWKLLTEHAEGISPDVRVRLEVGQFIAAIDYVKAQRLRRQLRDSMIAALSDADVLVLPTLPMSLPQQGLSVIQFAGRKMPLTGAMTRLSGPFNSAGMPAISIPCGNDDKGLPVSLQLVGRPGADSTVLAVAKFAENVLGQ
jgi:aspartyl-tRNA(Asn)/glutamyl-tRNA(Gln) amidotransferase subunit A